MASSGLLDGAKKEVKMIIEINDKEFGCENYEYEIYINGEKNTFNVTETGEKNIEAGENDIIEIRAKNIVLSSKWGWMLTLLYWIVALLTGSGESNPFGKPFDAYIQFKTSSAYIKLQANKIWKESAFDILNGELIVNRNEFVSTRKYKMRWFFGVVVPINILIILIDVMFLCTGAVTSSVIMTIFFMVSIICQICWNIYVCKIMKTLKK